MSSFQEYYPRMRELADYLLNNPELGYKEYKTSEAIEEAIHEITPMVKVEHFCNTGIKWCLIITKLRLLELLQN